MVTFLFLDYNWVPSENTCKIYVMSRVIPLLVYATINDDIIAEGRDVEA